MKKKHSKAEEIAASINTALKLEHGVRIGSDPYFTIERISTGSLVIDRVTGGGWALGRHYELFGDENAGKSTITYLTMALSQQRGNICAVVDPEHAFDSERFSFLGGYPEDLLLFHPENSEEAIAVMMLLAKHAKEQTLEVITIDSVSSLVTTEEMEKDPREVDRVASQARMMSRALRRITAVNKKTLFLWTNQERVDVGIKFGNPKVTSGGKALRYYATGRVEFRLGAKEMAKRKRPRAGKMVDADVEIGRWVQVRAVKEKSTRPLREGSFVFSHEQRRIDPGSEIIMLGLEDELIENVSGRYKYVDLDDYEWRGSYKQFSRWIRDNPELHAELANAISENSREVVHEEDG